MQAVVVDRVLGPVLAQGSTATGSLTHPVVSMVTERNVKVLSNSVSTQCKLQNKYCQLNLATVILRAAL